MLYFVNKKTGLRNSFLFGWAKEDGSGMTVVKVVQYLSLCLEDYTFVGITLLRFFLI